MTRHHFLVLGFAAQGILNPALQFSNRLLHLGHDVTLATTINAQRRLSPSSHLPSKLKTVYYSDGYDDGFNPSVDDHTLFVSEIKRQGTKSLKRIIAAAADEGSPFHCVVYCLLLPWAAAVARELNLPSALLWIQPATVFDIYYFMFHGFEEAILGLVDGDESSTLSLPGLEILPFTRRELPSIIVPKDDGRSSALLEIFREHMEELDLETRPRVLVNTFDELELDALRLDFGSTLALTAVGPLIPTAADEESNIDLVETSDHSYINWLDKKADSSVVYISFGSMSVLSKEQVEEVGRALVEVGRPFLWIMRDQAIVCMEELLELGLIVNWCNQVEVLSHRAVGCFLTHCGWNSTLEGLVYGVPMVGFPQWTDQLTNAKLVEEYWKVGLRVRESEKGEIPGLVESGEIKRCVEVVMGDAEVVGNGKRWSKLAVEATKFGGGSDRNLRDFVKEVVDIMLTS